MRSAKHLIVSGRVRGVGYRDFVQREAVRLGLDGWVRNRRDGTVEIVVDGQGAAVQALVAACGQGPHHASVANVVVSDWQGDAISPTSGFSISPNA